MAVSDNEIAVALVRRLEGQRPKVLRIVVEEAPGGFADPVLRKIIADFDLRSVPVSAVINASDYQIAQVQAPDVPRAEQRAAARYSLRDAFDFPIDSATLDLFDLPELTSSGNKRMCFAVATRGDAVEQISGNFERQFRKFDVIDIPELCQRNLSALLPQDAKGVAFLMIRDDFAQLVLTRRGHLYVTRRFEFGVRGDHARRCRSIRKCCPSNCSARSTTTRVTSTRLPSATCSSRPPDRAPTCWPPSSAHPPACASACSISSTSSTFRSTRKSPTAGCLHGHRRGPAHESRMSAAMQEINLYQPVAKGVRGALSAGSTRNILLLVTTTLLGMWAFAWWQVDRARRCDARSCATSSRRRRRCPRRRARSSMR